MRFNYSNPTLLSTLTLNVLSILENDIGYIKTSNNVTFNFLVKCFNKQLTIRSCFFFFCCCLFFLPWPLSVCSSRMSMKQIDRKDLGESHTVTRQHDGH